MLHAVGVPEIPERRGHGREATASPLRPLKCPTCQSGCISRGCTCMVDGSLVSVDSNAFDT